MCRQQFGVCRWKFGSPMVQLHRTCRRRVDELFQRPRDALEPAECRDTGGSSAADRSMAVRACASDR